MSGAAKRASGGPSYLLMTEELRNWAGNRSFAADRVRRPRTIEEIQEIVLRSTKLRALGTRHSFNEIGETSGDLVSTENLTRVVCLDRKARRVIVEGGISYGRLCQVLAEAGLALPNMASLPHISVAGACATATHGSGERNGNLATAVTSLDIVRADGTLVSISKERDGDRFNGSVVSLGALGVVARLTLELLPSFSVRQRLFENLPLDDLVRHFDEIESSAYSVSLFTEWKAPVINQVWLKQVDDREFGDSFFGASAAIRNVNPIPGAEAVNCTDQMGVAGSWHERLPHFRMEFTPSSGDELQTEYLVPRANALDAILSVSRLRDRIAPLLHICEVRAIAADELWMSPCYHQECIAIHFTWKKMPDQVTALLPDIETALVPLGARPHWGKIFSMPPDHVRSQYPRLGDFQALMKEFDPGCKFENEFLSRYVSEGP